MTALQPFSSTLDDLRISRIRPLLSPAILQEQIPFSGDQERFVFDAREAVSGVVEGKDPRMLVVVGPCSIHDVDAALEYADRLRTLDDELHERLLLVMRVYFEKPRTTVGWKGLINDPDLDGSFRINQGLETARRLLVDLADRGVRAGTEFLDTLTPQFLADTVSWGAIGARTTESQIHRELTSGLSMSVGFKNGIEGSVQVAIDAITAARHPHSFLSITKQGVAAIVETMGNPHTHLILRGSSKGPNSDPESVAQTCSALESAGLPPRVMIDCSHGNSRKVPTRQTEVALDLADRVERGESRVFGLMLESNLVGGSQSLAGSQPLVRGQSITDPCIGWEDTEQILRRLAEAVDRQGV